MSKPKSTQLNKLYQDMDEAINTATLLASDTVIISKHLAEAMLEEMRSLTRENKDLSSEIILLNTEKKQAETGDPTSS